MGVSRSLAAAAVAVTAIALGSVTARAGQASPHPALPAAGAQPAISATTDLGKRRFVVAGSRAYAVGVEDGTFPPIGWHTTGQMGGFWASPIKLLDGLWLSVGDQWLDDAATFTSGPGFARISFPATGGVVPTLTEFSPDGASVVNVGLTLVPADGTATDVPVRADAHSDVMAAYPWSGTTPTSDQLDAADIPSAHDGVLQFQQTGQPWYAEVGASTRPDSVTTGQGFFGPTPADQQAVFGTKGAGGELRWSLHVPAGGRTLWLGVAGSHDGGGEALGALRAGLRDPAGQLTAKVAERDRLAGQSAIDVPDASVRQALVWSNLNLADLRRTVTGLQIRDVKAGSAYPDPVATVPVLSGIDAAYPDYAEWFGTDGAYSIYGLAVSGQWRTAIDHLTALRTVSEIENGDTGKVVHEIGPTGMVYYGDNTDLGDVNETAQFAIAADLVWRWSGDPSVLRDNYAFINRGLRTLAANSFGGLWPTGHGIVEDPHVGGAGLDVASETIVALDGLAGMARAMGDSATAAWAGGRASAMRSAFDQWWIPGQSLYADSMCTTAGGECTEAGQLLQQRFWTSVAPMEQAVAPAARGNAALDRLETPTFNGSCGLFVDGVGGPEGTGGQSCYLVNTGALAVAEANYGRTEQAVTNMDKVASQLTVEMPGALPELAASANYDPFEAFTSRANVMQAWSSYGLLWTSVHDLLGVTADAPAGSVAVVPDPPSSWPSESVRDLAVGDSRLGIAAGHGRTVVTGASGLRLTIGTVLPAGTPVHSATLNGRPVAPTVTTTGRGEEVTVAVPHATGMAVLEVR